MAKITIIITDVDGHAEVEYIPDQDFDANGDLTPAQEVSLAAMYAITEDTSAEIADGELITVQ